MQYLLLIYSDEALWAPATRTDPATLQEISAAHMRLGAELQEAGAIVGANRLQTSEAATTVRTVAGAQSLHDGPYAETREQLGGYYLVEASIWTPQSAGPRRYSGGPNYAVEVRPVHAM